MAYTLTTDYSFREVTAKKFKVGDKFHTNDVVILDTFAKGTVLVRTDKGTSHTVAGRDEWKIFKENNYASGEYLVAFIPKSEPVKADPDGDLAVALLRAKYGDSSYTDDELKWARTDAGWLRLVKHLRSKFVARGTQIIVDSFDKDVWYKLADGTYSLNPDATSGRTEDYIRREYGIAVKAKLR